MTLFLFCILDYTPQIEFYWSPNVLLCFSQVEIVAQFAAIGKKYQL